MSTVLITHHNENITDLISKEVVVRVKSPRYRSKYRKKVSKQATRGKSAHRTFGVPCVAFDSPLQYLKKRSRAEPRRVTGKKHVHFRPPDYQRELPVWVPVKKVVKQGLPELPRDSTKFSRVNFRKRNIVNAKNSRSRQSRNRYVDTRRGDVHDLESSGLQPVYILRKNYGKLPKFVIEAQKAKGAIGTDKKSGKEELAQPLCRYVTAKERDDLLHGMKCKWDELTTQFQRLPFLTDTPPKAKRKEKLEKDLKQLERDIELIEKHPHIYVYSDSEDN